MVGQEVLYLIDDLARSLITIPPLIRCHDATHAGNDLQKHDALFLRNECFLIIAQSIPGENLVGAVLCMTMFVLPLPLLSSLSFRLMMPPLGACMGMRHSPGQTHSTAKKKSHWAYKTDV